MMDEYSNFPFYLQVFTWGSNYEGQLGSNEIGVSLLIPTKVSNLDDAVIKKIICGSSYVLAVNDICELYVWGSNNQGELGLGDFVSRLVPVKNEAIGRYVVVLSSQKSSSYYI